MSSAYRWLGERIVITQILLIAIVVLPAASLRHPTVLRSGYQIPAKVFASADSIHMNFCPAQPGLLTSRRSPANEKCSEPSSGSASLSCHKKPNSQHIFRASGKPAIGALLLVALLVAPER